MSRPRRRDLLRYAAAAALAAGCRGRAPAPSGPATAAGAAAATPPTTGPLDLLLLGGTGFLGPHIVEAALARGHRLTLFNRGKTHPEYFPELEKLRGDRDGQLGALRGRRWDAVVDTSGYVPRVVRQSAELLADAVGHYVFVSTVSVYAGFATPNADEDAPLAPLPDPATEDVGQHYGALKAACERAVEAALPGRATSVRPGLIVGPGDPTGRFTYWPTRLERGGEILAPGGGKDPVQLIDVRDLAAWIVVVLERRHLGAFNALGPAGGIAMADFLAQVAAGIPTTPRLTWVPTAVLEREGVRPWSDLPVWLPAIGEYAGAGTTSAARAIERGLAFRPISATARATLDWLGSLPPVARAAVTRGGLVPEREAAILARLATDGRARSAG